MTVAIRYEAEPDAAMLSAARQLLNEPSVRAAQTLGHALRLAYLLSAGTPDLLAGTTLLRSGAKLRLVLPQDGAAFIGDGVTRRMERLAQTLGLAPEVVVGGK